MTTLKIKRLNENAVLPSRATDHSAGYDLYACVENPVVVPAGGRVSIPCGIAVEISGAEAAGFIFGRSGLGAKHGIVPANAVGVIDADYRGEIMVCLANHADVEYTVRQGERIAQLVIMPILTPPIREVEELSRTVRGIGGFGSTGTGG